MTNGLSGRRTYGFVSAKVDVCRICGSELMQYPIALFYSEMPI